MSKAIMIIVLLGLGVSMFYPIYLPQPMVDVVTTVIAGLWAWEGILPILAILQVAAWLAFILFAWMSFKVIMNLLGSSQDMDG